MRSAEDGVHVAPFRARRLVLQARLVARQFRGSVEMDQTFAPTSLRQDYLQDDDAFAS